jgi:sugar/nucleoside kinase (ribokinase family)
VAVGHIVNDTEPHNHLGGGVAYSAMVAHNLGYDAHIVTKCPNDHEYITDLRKYGITVHVLPSTRSVITTFRNIYDEHGNRRQQCIEQQEMITVRDFDAFPQHILHNAIILVAPVIGEVETSLFPVLARYGAVAIAPQGYFRRIEQGGTVVHQEWIGYEDDIQAADVIVLSDEDAKIINTQDAGLIGKLCGFVDVVALTQGRRGSTIFFGGVELHTTAFMLQHDEINDLTGAGDTYAASFVARYIASNNIHQASLFASFYAALKVIGHNGVGIHSIPTKQQVNLYISEHRQRVDEFLEANHANHGTRFDLTNM